MNNFTQKLLINMSHINRSIIPYGQSDFLDTEDGVGIFVKKAS